MTDRMFFQYFIFSFLFIRVTNCTWQAPEVGQRNRYISVCQLMLNWFFLQWETAVSHNGSVTWKEKSRWVFRRVM